VVESFILLDPLGVPAAGAVPFWTLFPVQPSADRLAKYLQDREFDEIYAAMFPHGTQSAGWAEPAVWAHLIGQARKRRGFLGVNPRQQPADFTALARFEPAVHRLANASPPIRLTLDDLPNTIIDRGGA
jgi:hypothetical protein